MTSQPPNSDPGKNVPPPTLASPAQVHLQPNQEARWYLPGLIETLRLMRWRILYFLPALAFLILAFLTLFHWSFISIFILWWKIIIVAVALPVGAAARTARHAIRLRSEPFCIHCGYNLTGLPDGHHCPECGIRFDLAVINEYRRDPHWFIQRYQKHRDLPASPAGFDAGPNRSPRSRDGT